MQSCSKCGAAIYVFGDDAQGMCRACRARQGASEDGRQPFQNIGARRGRSMLTVRTAGLLFALAVVMMAAVALRGRVGKDAGEGTTPAPAASQRERIRIGNHDVEIFVVPPPASASGAGK